MLESDRHHLYSHLQRYAREHIENQSEGKCKFFVIYIIGIYLYFIS